MSLAHPNAGKQKLMHLLRTMLVTGMAYVVSYGITLVLTPYITETVGTEAYGFVTLAKQFAEYATIVTTALNTYAARYIGIAYHKNDMKQANMYFASVFWGDIILASCIFAAALAVIVFLEYIISIPAALVADVKVLFLLTFLSFWVTTVFSVFGCAGYVRDRMDLKGVFKTLSFITDALALLICYVFFPAAILYVGIGTLAAALVIAGTDWWMSRKYLPMLKTARKDFSFQAVKQLVMNGFWMSFNMVGDLLNNGLDLLVCNQMLTSLAMGQLAIAKTMHTIVKSLYLVVDQAFIPRFIKAYADEHKDKLMDELKLSMKVSGMLANIAFAGFVALGLSYYRLWIPNEDIELIYRLTIVTIMVILPTGAIHPLYYIYSLTLKQKIPCYVTLIGGIFNVAGMYVLIRYAGMGVYAVAWTTVAVMTFINFVSNPLYMAHVLRVPWHSFYPDILRNLLSCCVLTLLFYGLASLYKPTGWLTLILCAGGYALLGIPIHLAIVTNRDQRRRLAEAVRRKP
ncbi:MAG: oligosaccharide flippase family protein [Clostridia bacterium]|nr:oligosaccharide flippase family protein [Clostridia bacterium]